MNSYRFEIDWDLPEVCQERTGELDESGNEEYSEECWTEFLSFMDQTVEKFAGLYYEDDNVWPDLPRVCVKAKSVGAATAMMKLLGGYGLEDMGEDW